jgi:hypothetical protein
VVTHILLIKININGHLGPAGELGMLLAKKGGVTTDKKREELTP